MVLFSIYYCFELLPFNICLEKVTVALVTEYEGVLVKGDVEEL
jgi:hypothetical protein